MESLLLLAVVGVLTAICLQIRKKAWENNPPMPQLEPDALRISAQVQVRGTGSARGGLGEVCLDRQHIVLIAGIGELRSVAHRSEVREIRKPYPRMWEVRLYDGSKLTFQTEGMQGKWLREAATTWGWPIS